MSSSSSTSSSSSSSETRPLLNADVSNGSSSSPSSSSYFTFPNRPSSPDDSHLNSVSSASDVLFVLPSPKSAASSTLLEAFHDRQLNVFRFSMIAFFLVCGGPFGIELTVMAGGPFYTFLGFLIVPFVWAIPQALLTAELSSSYPENGGYVIWTMQAFGLFSAWIAGINGVISYIVDLALYPTLCASYTLVLFPQATSFELFLVKVAVVLLCLIVNLRGIKQVGTFSAIVTICVMFPFIISAIIQWRVIFDPTNKSWTQVPEEVDWGVFLSTLLWCYTGWDSLGNLAGEVKNPGRTYSRGSAVTLLLVTVCYSLPTFVSIQTHPDFENQWINGSLADFTADVAPFMRVVTVGTCILANIGLYSAGLSASSRAFWAMASGELPYVPRIFAHSVGSVPVVSLVCHTFVVISLFLFDFTVLVESGVLLACIRLLFEFASFVKFRFYQPDHVRPFKVPLGWFGVVCICLPILFITLFMAWSADIITWLFAVAVNLFGIAVYLIGGMTNSEGVAKSLVGSNGTDKETSGMDHFSTPQKLNGSLTSISPSTDNGRPNTRRVPGVPSTATGETLRSNSDSDEVRPELSMMVSVNSIVINTEQIAREQARKAAEEKAGEDKTKKQPLPPPSSTSPSSPAPFTFSAPTIVGIPTVSSTEDDDEEDYEADSVSGDDTFNPSDDDDDEQQGRRNRTESAQIRQFKHRATPVYKPTGVSLIKQAKEAYRKKKNEKKAKLQGLHRESSIEHAQHGEGGSRESVVNVNNNSSSGASNNSGL